MAPTRVRFVAVAWGVALLTAGGLIGGRLAVPQAATAGGGRASAAPAGKDGPKVKELLKERLTIFRELARQVATSHKAGAASEAELHQANVMVLYAELELSETPEERVAVLEKILLAAKQQEDLVAQAGRAGTVTAPAVLRAKAERVDAEIALERAKARSKAPPE